MPDGSFSFRYIIIRHQTYDRLWRIWYEPQLLLVVLRGFGHAYYALILRLSAFGGIGYFTSHISVNCSVKLFLQYMESPGIDTT